MVLLNLKKNDIIRISIEDTESFIMTEYELNLSLKELEKRTNKDYLVTKKVFKG